jgi:hypothetical protein
MFERTDTFATLYPRININDTVSIATTNGQQLTMGTYSRGSGKSSALTNNSSGIVDTISTTVALASMINYTITRGTAYRTGTIMIASNGASANLTWNDEFVENSSTGVTLSVSQTGTDVNFNYTTSNTGTNGTIRYSITYLA